MYLSALRLTHFRSYTTLDWRPTPGVNCLVGLNGAGKTNLLEAVHFLAMTRGFGADKDAVQNGEKFFLVEGDFENAPDFHNVKCGYAARKGKKMILDSVPAPRLADHIGKAPVVTVLPEDVALIRAGGTERRKWLDSFLSQSDPAYLNALILYQKTLERRNALLQHFYETNAYIPEELEAWNENIIRYGIIIRQKRIEFLAEFQSAFTHFHAQVIPQGEAPALVYECKPDENTPQAWRQALAQTEANDRRLRRTTLGVHRDDVGFYIKNQPIKPFGSQGQQKTFVFALKFAQYQYLGLKTKRAPLLLLDDIFDKLDDERLKRIAELLTVNALGQTFITDVSYARLRGAFQGTTDDAPGFFKVENGNVTPY